jgi:hypothetical protein
MVEAPVNQALVTLALEAVDTANFEAFAQSFYASQVGKSFVPLGGMHDGGAEGFIDPEVFGDSDAKHFIQVSKQKTYRAKIRGTVNRLRQYGRNPTSLAYITSVIVSDIDIEEDNLSEELGCRIRIRDGKYISTHINEKDSYISSFNTYLLPAVSYLSRPGATNFAPRTAAHADRTLAVFLRQEVDNRRGKSDLLESVADSLIIWALTDTDPDKNVLMTRGEILIKIETALPSARHFIRGVLDVRLERLRTKQDTSGRQVRYYTRQEAYCLPFETRELIKTENVEDASLKSAVTAVFVRRYTSAASHLGSAGVDDVVRVCHEVLQRLFEKQGLQVAQFVTNGDQDDEIYANAASLISEVIDSDPTIKTSAADVRRVCTIVLRGTFYDGTEEERSYLEKLSRTYVLLLLLKNEPKVVEYFKNISSKFVLYVGTDFLVRALSEHYLDEENQSTTNLFKVLTNAGASLVLTEKAVEELATHIRSQIYEFENTYMHIEGKIPVEVVEYIDRILIRSYFYARLAPMSSLTPPPGWRSYVENFASYSDIKSNRGDDELARYLVAKFGMVYKSTEEMEKSVNKEELEELLAEIIRVKSDAGRTGDHLNTLAYNDALHVLTVYSDRAIGGESSPANPFGFKTWWLTLDGGVRKASAKTVAKHFGQRFMMRPEFLLNFISLAPTMSEVKDSFATIFPSVLGVKLSNRVADYAFKDIVRSANEVWSVDEARASAMISALTDKLKGDTLKVYENEW